MRLVADVAYGTTELLRTPDYAFFWSTRGLVPGDDPLDPASFVEKPIRFDWAYDFALAVPVLLVLSVAALLAYRTWSRQIVWLVVPLILSSWVLRTVLYWAKPRYGYFIHVMLIFTAALALAAIVDTNRRTRSQRTAAG